MDVRRLSRPFKVSLKPFLPASGEQAEKPPQRGYALVSHNFTDALQSGQLELTMVHALVRLRWEVMPDLGPPTVEIGLRIPPWMHLREENSFVYGEALEGISILGHIPRASSCSVWLAMVEGNRFALGFAGRGKVPRQDIFYYRAAEAFLITPDASVVVIPETSPLFKKNPILVEQMQWL